MATNPPTILLVFSDPAEDLPAIKQEMIDLSTMLYVSQDEKTIVLKNYPHVPLMNVITSISSQTGGVQVGIFHYSGHANEHNLLFPDGAKSEDAVCHLLKKAGVQIAFLNGCSTKGMIEKIFDTTDVSAVLATHRPVGDKKAASISALFYRQFIWNGQTLDQSFRDLQANFTESLTHKDGYDMDKERDLDAYEKAFPDEHDDQFQWAMFYRTPHARNLSIRNLLDANNETLKQLNKEIDDLEKEIAELDSGLAEMLEISPNNRNTRNYMKDEATRNKRQGLLDLALSRRRNMAKSMQEAENTFQEKNLAAELDDAIKKLNYSEQRKKYWAGIDNHFSCYAAVGDADDLIDLLLISFKRDHNFQDNNIHEIPIKIGVSSNAGFWPALAEYTNQSSDTSITDIVKYLVRELYFGGRPERTRSSQHHIFVKLNVTGIDTELIAAPIKEFWETLHSYISASGFFKDPNFSIKHKIVMLLLDDEANKAREDELKIFEEKINKVLANLKLDTQLNVMPIIDTLNESDISTWIQSHTLYRVGLAHEMAAEIFKDSKTGKIKKVLRCVKKKIKVSNVQIFNELNI